MRLSLAAGTTTPRPLVSVLPTPRPRLMSVGTSNPMPTYTQDEVASLLAVAEGVGRRFFRTSGIETRHLYLSPTAEGRIPDEDQRALLERHRRASLELGGEAIVRCLDGLGLITADIDFLCCVSSTGMMLPGLSAMYIRHLGFRHDCQRIDIVGMGCNAALNGLNTTTAWTTANRGRHALMVCCEINSAVHSRDESVVTALVNSLFGDGCAAMVMKSNDESEEANSDSSAIQGPEVLALASQIVPEAWRAISYHWMADTHRFALFLDKDIPKVLGIHSPKPVSGVLDAMSLCRRDVKHWLVHAGGKKVIGAIGEANGLTDHDLRHSTDVLRQYGNLGSPSVLFSYQALLKKDVIAKGDYGVMVTMGPGAQIEAALLRW
jgi:3,5-dihydroxyphenylacetyl-CoA synthase